MIKFAHQDTTKKTIAFLIIGLMALFIINKTVFLHSHRLTNGTVVTHAHPYSKTADSEPFKFHHHTNAAFFMFDTLELLYLSAVLALLFFITPAILTFRFSAVPKYSPEYASYSRNRAPPVRLNA